MKNFKLLFNKISYLQYPLIIIAAFFTYKSLIIGTDVILDDLNLTLLILGLGISFSTLQDTSKTQNKISKKIRSNERLCEIALTILFILTFFFISIGTIGVLATESEFLNQIGLSSFALGIGMSGLLKAAVEMAENHQKKYEISINT